MHAGAEPSAAPRAHINHTRRCCDGDAEADQRGSVDQLPGAQGDDAFQRRNLGSCPLVFARCSVRQRYFAGIANIGDVSLHAGLNAALARLGVCTLVASSARHRTLSRRKSATMSVVEFNVAA